MLDWGSSIYMVYVCKKIYLVSPITPKPEGPINPVRIMWWGGEDKPVGFFYDREEAFNLIRERSDDLHENYYTYAFVEEITSGLGFLGSETRWVFKMNSDIGQYEELEIPEFLTDNDRLVLE